MKIPWYFTCLGIALWLSACQAAAPPAASAPLNYPGDLREPGSFGPNFQWRQRITANWATGTRSFEAVLAKDGNELQLVGLSPMGMPGFVLRLSGRNLQVENNTQQAIPFDPRNVLLDVQRTFFPWFKARGPQAGTRRVQAAEEEVQETWAHGQLVERRFRRLDGKPAGEIVVEYGPWPANADAPSRAKLQNNWFGYSLTIETLEQQRLP